MNQSQEINEIAAALAKAQGQMNAAAKDSTNPHFKSKYADLASVWQACREPLSANGLSVTQTLDLAGEKQVLITTLFHSSGQWIRSIMMMPMCSKPQETGSILSYYRRYSLASMCGVYQSDDDAEIAQTPHRQQPAKSVNIEDSEILTKEEAEAMDKMLNKIEDQEYVSNLTVYVRDNMNVDSMYHLKRRDYQKIINSISQKLRKEDEQRKLA